MKSIENINKFYVCDLETYTNEPTGVYSWAIYGGENEIAGEVIHTPTNHREKDKVCMKNFLNECVKINNKYEKDVVFYFHNLGFDGQFVFDYLLANKWIYLTDYKQFERHDVQRRFTASITDLGQFFNIKCFYWQKINGKFKKRTIVFLDSAKIITCKVSEMKRAFGLTSEYTKGEIDYNNPEHHTNDDILKYNVQDCRIVWETLTQLFANKKYKITKASTCFAEWKEIIGARRYKQMFYKQYDINIEHIMRNAYKGGLCLLKNTYRGIDRKNIVLDVNSMYPAQMLYLKRMPYGTPSLYKGKLPDIENEFYKIYICDFDCEVKENHIPCILEKAGKAKTKTCVEYKGEYYCDEVEYGLIENSYNGRLKIKETVYFKTCKNDIFTDYINLYYDMKKTAPNKVIRQIAKDFLNSLYGKFGERTESDMKEPFYDEHRVVRYKSYNADKDGKYLPIAMVITSSARRFLIESINRIYDGFIYCDTDSLHIDATKYSLDKVKSLLWVDNDALGAWKVEHDNADIIHYGEKLYFGESNNKILCASVGLTLEKENEYVSYKGQKIRYFDVYNTIKAGGIMVLKKKNVKGGCILYDTEYTIKDMGADS